MEKWEYVYLSTRRVGGSKISIETNYGTAALSTEVDPSGLVAALNKLGNEGWEMVGAFSRGENGNTEVCLFKRPAGQERMFFHDAGERPRNHGAKNGERMKRS